LIASLNLLRRYGACCAVLCPLLVAPGAWAEPWFFNYSGGGVKFNSSAEVCEDYRKTIQKSNDEVAPGGITTIVVYPDVDIAPTERVSGSCVVNWRRGDSSFNYQSPVYAGGCWPGRAPKPGVDLNSFFAESGDCADTLTPPVPPAPPCDCPLLPGVEPAGPGVGNPIFVLRGIKRESVDTGLRLAGLGLRFTYDSGQRAPQTGATTLQPVPMSARWSSGDVLGSVLWSSSLHRRAVIGSMVPGSAFAVRLERGDGVVKVIGVDSSGNFSFDPADRGRLVRLASGELRYDDAQEGVTEVYTASGQLTTMAWPEGRRLDFTYSDANTPTAIASAGGLLLQVTDTNGRSLSFAYGAPAGFGIRLASVTDAAGQTVTLAYDSRNNLNSLQWPDGTTRSFHYESSDLPWALTGVSDEKVRRHATFGYDAEGRAVSSEHAGGVSRYSVSYATPPSLAVNEQFDGSTLRRQVGWTLPQGTVVTGPTGTASQWQATSLNGRNFLIARSQAAGAGSANGMRAQGYDAHGYVASQDDFNGTRMCFSNDPERNMQLARVEGLAAGADCAVLTAASLPAKARKTSTQWHPDWRRPIKVAEPGQITTSVYNGQPDPLNGNAIASCEPGTAPLLDGKPIAVLCKQAVQATTDADGHLGFSATLQAGAAIRVSTWTYNESGQALTARTTRGGVTVTTSSTYFAHTDANHTKGDLATATDAAGKVTTYDKYTKAGQVLQSTDSDGVVTVNTYDLRQRLLTTTVGGETTTYAYDPVGQLILVTQHDGSWTAYEYDDAHRQKAVSDDSGNRIEYALDNAGNSTGQTVKDPTGSLKRNMARVMDALGRAQENSGRE
jgi:YD repeat-containing protein